MKYQLSGIIDAELTTLGKAVPELTKLLVDGGYEELAAEKEVEPVYIIKGNGRYYKSYVLGPYLRPADSPVDRVRIELEDLAEKRAKLGIFLGTPKFLLLDKDMCDLLHSQFKVMKEYEDILKNRLELMQKQ